MSPLDPVALKSQFPLFQKLPELVYLDNASTTQKPARVIEATRRYYEEYASNVHRASYAISAQAEEAYEGTRETIRAFLNAASTDEIVFTRGATEGVNLVAQTFGRANIHSGDEIIVSEMEHHANFVPWQMLCEQTGATLRIIPIGEDGALCMETYGSLLCERTKLVAVVHVSNGLGTVNPVQEIVRGARSVDAAVLIDAAQSAYHMPLDVQALDCDFLVFSGHKLYGPTGIGVLYGKRERLEAMPAWHGGGDMIKTVTVDGYTVADVPIKFEAGTPNIAGGIGLGAAIDFLNEVGLDRVEAHERSVMEYGLAKLATIPEFRLIGSPNHRVSVISFTVEGCPAADVAELLDLRNIAVRVGKHCAHPTFHHFGVTSAARASLACYNSVADMDALHDGLVYAIRTLRRG